MLSDGEVHCLQKRYTLSTGQIPLANFNLRWASLTVATDGWDVAQLVERQTHMLPTQVRFPGVARDFCPRVNFQCRLSYRVHTLLCAITCIYSCAHIKDPVVHVRVWWIKETLEDPACLEGCVVRLYGSWLSLGKATPISHGRNPVGMTEL